MIFDPSVHPPPSPLYAQFFGEAFNRLFAVATRIDQVLGGQLRVTSWHRTAAENARLPGASPTSQHLLGTGLDVSGRHLGVSSDLLLQVARRIAPAFRVEALNNEGYTHVHLQAFPYGTSAAILGLMPWLRWTGAVAQQTTTRKPASSRVVSV